MRSPSRARNDGEAFAAVMTTDLGVDYCIVPVIRVLVALALVKSSLINACSFCIANNIRCAWSHFLRGCSNRRRPSTRASNFLARVSWRLKKSCSGGTGVEAYDHNVVLEAKWTH